MLRRLARVALLLAPRGSRLRARLFDFAATPTRAEIAERDARKAAAYHPPVIPGRRR